MAAIRTLARALGAHPVSREDPVKSRSSAEFKVDNWAISDFDGLETSLVLGNDAGHQPRPLFFVDGDHAYESVLRELMGITAEIPDASILVHDAFYQSSESGYNVGPHRAITNILEQMPGRYRRLDRGLGLPGMAFVYPADSA